MSKLSQGNNDWSPSWYYVSTHQNIQNKYLNTDPAYPPSIWKKMPFLHFVCKKYRNYWIFLQMFWQPFNQENVKNGRVYLKGQTKTWPISALYLFLSPFQPKHSNQFISHVFLTNLNCAQLCVCDLCVSWGSLQDLSIVDCCPTTSGGPPSPSTSPPSPPWWTNINNFSFLSALTACLVLVLVWVSTICLQNISIAPPPHN